MVQLFYWESRGQSAYKLLKKEGYPNKILLFPYEGWARPACQTYWIVKTPWWSKKRCKVVQISGTTKLTGKGKITEPDNGSLIVTGKLKHTKDAPRFRLYLTTNVSNADFQMGYSMTGILERGIHQASSMEFTHYAMIKRKGY